MTFRIQGLPAANLQHLIQSRANPDGLEQTLDEFIINISTGVFTIEDCDIEYVAGCTYRVFEKDRLNENDLNFLTGLLNAVSIHSELNQKYPGILDSATEYVSALVA